MAKEIINEFNKRHNCKTSIRLGVILGLVRVVFYLQITLLCEESVKSTAILV